MGLFRKGVGGESRSAVGIDLGQSHLVVLGLQKKLGKAEVTHFRLEARPATPEAVTERLKAVFKEEGLNPENVRVAFKDQGIVIRILTFPQMKKEEFASAIQYEAEKYIPFKLSEVMLDFQILSEGISRGNSEVMEVLLVAVKQAEIYRFLRPFQDAGLRVQLVDIGAFAFANALEYLLPETKEQTIGFLDVGTESSTFGVAMHGRPVFIRDISFGGIDILNLIKRKLGLTPEAVWALEQNAERIGTEYRAVVEQSLATLVGELKLSVGYYMDHVAEAQAIESLYLGGGGARFAFSSEYLGREIRIPTLSLKITPRIEVRPGLDSSVLEKEATLLPVALGLCLRT